MKCQESRESYRRYYEKGYEIGHPLNYGVEEAGVESRAVDLRAQTVALLRAAGLETRPDVRVLELGSALGDLRDVHPGWIGFEFSAAALRRTRERFGKRLRLLQGDMRQLPFAEGSVDAVFSWATLEHVPRPELALGEIARVLKKGGVAILAPAWNCRSWTVKRLPFRRYGELSPLEMLEKATIPLRERLLWRALWAFPRRVLREARALEGRALPFDYVPLHPDLSVDLPHVADDDAQSSMDPHAAITYFRSRGWSIPSHPSLKRRMMARHEPVVAQKPP